MTVSTDLKTKKAKESTMSQPQKPIKKMHLATHLTMLPTTLRKDSKTLIPTSTAGRDDHAIDNNQNMRQITKELVRLFGEWQLNFGNKAKAEDYPMHKAILWATVIIHLQPTGDQWQQTRQRSILEEWPPSSARDLLALADTSEQDYPNSRHAYLDAAQQKYVHAVVYETARRVGFSDMRNKAETTTYHSWQQIYPKVYQEYSNGVTFALPKSRQIAHKHIPMSNDSPMAATVDTFLREFGRQGI